MKSVSILIAMVLIGGSALLAGCEAVNRLVCEEVADPCSHPSEVKCSEDGLSVLSCLGNEQGCLVWTPTASCSSDAQCRDQGGQVGCACSDACPGTGLSQCSGTVIETCALGSDGCLEWVAGQDCADEQGFCDSTADPVVCSDSCTDECQGSGQVSCQDSLIVACQTGDDGCLDLVVQQDCAADGLYCDPSSSPPTCTASCADRCPQTGLSYCEGTAVMLCQHAPDGCLDWVLDHDCAEDGQFCDNTVRPVACADSCTDECLGEGLARCAGSLILVCTEGIDGCLDWVTEQDCQQNDPPATCGSGVGGPMCVGPCTSNDACPSAQFCQLDSCDSPSGACVVRPEGCPENYDPVCGCDGQTYGNECEAASMGVSVDYSGSCEVPQCWSHDMCLPEEFCFYSSCGLESGICFLRPAGCEEIWDPVCSCDGQTFDNACLAAQAGASIAYEGTCQTDYCWDHTMCAQTEYCFFEICAQETGLCMSRPVDCPHVWDPVCGCDGNTYANSCAAAAMGVSVDYLGECASQYCWDNDMCGPGSYCFFEFCALESGICQVRPDSCPEVWDPVCGCDGETYPNACVAAMEGVSVDYPGECASQSCFGNEMCAPGSYCFFEVCAQETGVCLPRPQGCPDVWDPVCGCDGLTYGNECEAAAMGKSVDYRGECTAVQCATNSDCDQWAYCLLDSCGDSSGSCVPRPEDCPYLWDPVCGCDGQTYANECLAGYMGVNVDYWGECVAALCSSNVDCMNGLYCMLESCAAETGTCLPIPQGCPDIWDPVCGCDGNTYGNGCEAAAAGVSVAYRGECQ